MEATLGLGISLVVLGRAYVYIYIGFVCCNTQEKNSLSLILFPISHKLDTQPPHTTSSAPRPPPSNNPTNREGGAVPPK